MLEIFIIIAVSKKIATMMKEKGRSAAGYVVLFVFLWIFGELTGAVVGVIATVAQNNHVNDGFSWLILVGALLGAATGGGAGYMIASVIPPLEDERQRYLDTLDDDDDRDREDDDDRPRRRRRVEKDDGRFEDSNR